MAYYNEFDIYGENIVAITDNGEKRTYSELGEYCAIVENIVPKRSLVFMFCQNTIGSLFGYIGFLKNKSVPLLVDSHLDKDMRDNLINTYCPQYLYVPDDMTSLFDDVDVVYKQYSYSLLKTHFSNTYELNENLALLLTTSGSTGSPKLVRQSYSNIQINAESIAQYLQLDSKERPITTLPMNYTYGLSIINSHLLMGATILLTNKTLMEKEFWMFFKEEKGTSFGGVPYTYEILKKLRFFKMDLPSLKTMTQAGGKLSPELHKEFAEYAIQTGRHFIVMYGQTEATARMAYLPHEKSLDKYGSMGIAIPGGSFSLIDIEGNEILEAEVTGELVYRGQNVTLGYAECGEDLKVGDERNGVLITGDMAKRDQDGFYYIVGRKKRFLKLFGNRVNMDEIERMVKTEFEIMDCVCGGLDDKMYLFISQEYEKTDKQAVTKFLSEKTGINGKAFIVKTIPEIPKNEAGKILYKKLEEYYD